LRVFNRNEPLLVDSLDPLVPYKSPLNSSSPSTDVPDRTRSQTRVDAEESEEERPNECYVCMYARLLRVCVYVCEGAIAMVSRIDT